jgi:hypothetical protein
VPDAAPLQNALDVLKDVDGVLGSFVIMEDGQLLCRDMGAFFTDELLLDVGPRVLRLASAFSTANEHVISCSLQYGEHMLHVRFMERGRLCVLTAREINAPAVRMVMNMVVRSLDGLLAEASSTWPS